MVSEDAMETEVRVGVGESESRSWQCLSSESLGVKLNFVVSDYLVIIW